MGKGKIFTFETTRRGEFNKTLHRMVDEGATV